MMNKITLENIEPLDYKVQEAYRTLRGNIVFCGTDIQTIAITSTVPNEGKSSVSLNLAVMMAEAGYRVLFIDADLRKSVIAGKYRVGMMKEGLTNYLSGTDKWEDCLCTTEYENLDVILAGPVPPNPSELLGKSIFSEKLGALKKEYNYIIIDTPPIGSVIDGAVIASACDGAVIVVEAGKTSSRHVNKTKVQIEKTGCKILGAVLNKASKKTGTYDRYTSKDGYYGSYYGK